jgi:uncharacterized protein
MSTISASDVQSNVQSGMQMPAPVHQRERITALDTLRGFALLGILLMNIVGMGLIAGAYDDPTAAGGSTGANLGVWAILHVLAEGKMRCLFSMVFGASVILLTSRLERTESGRAISGDIYYRRTLWLMLFGIVHAFLLWYGDILYLYALCGLALFPFRKMAPRALLTIGIVIGLLDSGLYIAGGYYYRDILTKGQAAVAAEQAGQKLTDAQQSDRRQYESWRKENRPTPQELKKNDDAWRGNFLSVVSARAKLVTPGHNSAYYSPLSGTWDVWAMMFIGMALFKMGVFSAQRSTRFYGTLVLICYGVGIPLNSYSAWTIIRSHFDPVIHMYWNSTYDLGRLTIALGHMGVIMLLCQAGALRWLMSSLGAVGQMAFSNYIMHSVITAFFFTGYGLKMYGKLERYELYYVVAAIWVFQLIASPIWLAHFRFGPLEWCWRSLTYWKRQPMRLESANSIAAGA